MWCISELSTALVDEGALWNVIKTQRSPFQTNSKNNTMVISFWYYLHTKWPNKKVRGLLNIFIYHIKYEFREILRIYPYECLAFLVSFHLCETRNYDIWNSPTPTNLLSDAFKLQSKSLELIELVENTHLFALVCWFLVGLIWSECSISYSYLY